MAAVVVASLVAQIEEELEAVVDTIGDRIRAEIPDFRRLPQDTLARAVRGNVSRALAALRELRDPSPEELDGLRRVELPAWEDVRAAAVASPDVHVTKLVYSCRTEQAATGDPLYAWLAARAVELV